jgi:hypothetical protein
MAATIQQNFMEYMKTAFMLWRIYNMEMARTRRRGRSGLALM